ncbi:MAG: spermidine synthase [Alphaproteobacteria bacterium PA4]|nr:MAG: spermidine synthase [Alphaproteobacteria bacterium PA4]
MIPRLLLGTAAIPGGGELKLFQRGDDFMIALDRNELMSSRMSGSEEALAEMAIARLGDRPAPHILIGGYGMGFTLRKALALLGPRAQVSVAELVPGIIEWAEGPMAALTGNGLTDPRTLLVMGDVGMVIEHAQAKYDAILLDVDNGPDGLSRAENNRLYSRAGIAAARMALRPGGVLAIWSAAPDPAFTRRLEGQRFDVEEVVIRARANGKGPRHVIWFATKRAGA